MDMHSDTSAPRFSPPAHHALADLWHQAGLPAEALDHADLPGSEPVLPSSFAVATAAQASLAAAELWLGRTGRRQRVQVPREHAALECCGHFTLDGKALDPWDKLSGLYPCGADAGEPGWVRIHANFAHHRDGADPAGLPQRPDHRAGCGG